MPYSSIKPSKCKECGSPYHSPMYHKPRKPIAVKSVPKRTALSKKKYHITQFGKTRVKWVATRHNWMSTIPKPWPCHYCGTPLNEETLTLDHKIPRSRAPELRHEFSNLVPCCFTCNGLKGSVDHDSYKHTCH